MIMDDIIGKVRTKKWYQMGKILKIICHADEAIRKSQTVSKLELEGQIIEQVMEFKSGHHTV